VSSYLLVQISDIHLTASGSLLPGVPDIALSRIDLSADGPTVTVIAVPAP
jgi:hypothetical protein